jgi:superfamily I DNA/RNA helicase
VGLAFRLIKNGIAAHVEGKEIGKGLTNLVKKWKKITTVEELNEKLDDHFTMQEEKLIAKGHEDKVEGLRDRIDTIKILAEGCELISEVVIKIESLFADTHNGSYATVLLSTVHKAKGREWPRVYILGFREFMPSKLAKQPWQMEQEINLIYVAATRAMKELVTMATLDDDTPRTTANKRKAKVKPPVALPPVVEDVPVVPAPKPRVKRKKRVA